MCMTVLTLEKIFCTLPTVLIKLTPQNSCSANTGKCGNEAKGRSIPGRPLCVIHGMQKTIACNKDETRSGVKVACKTGTFTSVT